MISSNSPFESYHLEIIKTDFEKCPKLRKKLREINSFHLRFKSSHHLGTTMKDFDLFKIKRHDFNSKLFISWFITNLTHRKMSKESIHPRFESYHILESSKWNFKWKYKGKNWENDCISFMIWKKSILESSKWIWKKVSKAPILESWKWILGKVLNITLGEKM